jgi:replicative DNA helicase
MDPSVRRVSAETLESAVTIARYCIPHAFAAFGCMGQRNETEYHAVRVLRWFQAAGLGSFTERDVWQTLRRSFRDEVHAIRPALEELAARNYLREAPMPERKGPGRKPSPRWEVNPAVLSRNPQDPRNT